MGDGNLGLGFAIVFVSVHLLCFNGDCLSLVLPPSLFALQLLLLYHVPSFSPRRCLWWKSSSSSSPSSTDPKRSSSAEASPKSTRRSWASSGTGEESLFITCVRVTRGRGSRVLFECGPVLDAAISLPESRSPSNLDSAAPTRSSSSPVLLPHPLPLPEGSHHNGACAAAACTGGCMVCRLPSPMGTMAAGAVETEDGNGLGCDFSVGLGTEVSGEMVSIATGRSAGHYSYRSLENSDLPSKGYNFISHRKAIHNPDSVESLTFRLNIPTKSAPPSGFSSPVLSPRRLGNVDILPSAYNSPQRLQIWSAPEAPYMDLVTDISPQTSPDKIHGSPDLSPLHTGALCAMKEVNIIPDDPKSAECLKQLEQEIKVLSKLKHPNIVQYYGSELTEDRFFIYLEYVYPGSINKYGNEHCGAMTESVDSSQSTIKGHDAKSFAEKNATDLNSKQTITNNPKDMRE
ncbi:hypothetical protein HPP92_018746 [Vanilla planifolia]|uniref:Protein kinase domain-containing protein n=1 Tax=Vanilla planifolia TaxID=51239 RepID=A0A835Q6A6_VANPL|nr:hypothetical protein HPP92_018746 [Vanilla planifolia]